MRPNASIKLTAKQLSAYKAMRRGGPSANDGYDLQAYGMTYAQYRAIQKIAESAFGMGGDELTLAIANKLLAGEKVAGTRLSDSAIDAVANAFSKVRRNSRRRTSRRRAR